MAQDISRLLVERGHHVHVIAPYLKGLPFRSQVNGVSITRLPSLRKLPYSADLMAMMGYLLAGFMIGLWKIWRFKPDLIHVHFAVPAGALAWILFRLTGIPYVLTTHLGDVPGGVPEKTEKWFRWIYPFTPHIWRDAAGVTAISEYTRQLALQHYPRDIRVIPNGIDIQSVKRGETITLHSPARIIFAGRFVPQKNLFTLINILNEIREQNWECVLVGDGFLMEDVNRRLASCELAHRIRLTGWLTPEQVLAEMGKADIFFMPSLAEGISISALQSLALGLAIVASDVGGLGEIVEQGRNGFLHQPSDVDGFAASLRSLLNDRALLHHARLESSKIAERFDLSIVVSAYEDAFAQAIVRVEAIGSSNLFSG